MQEPVSQTGRSLVPGAGAVWPAMREDIGHALKILRFHRRFVSVKQTGNPAHPDPCIKPVRDFIASLWIGRIYRFDAGDFDQARLI